MRSARCWIVLSSLFAWLGALAEVPATGKVLVVNLDRQTLTGYLDGKLQFSYNVVTGDEENPTRPGQFRVVRKERFWVSRQYGARMDYALFFDGGKAIHESHFVEMLKRLKAAGRSVGLSVQESIGSHGCVRLAPANAKIVFEWTPLRTPVLVVEEKVKPPS